MAPFEVMVSESQERMLCVCEPARVDEVLAVCASWEVHGTAIGAVTDTGLVRVLRDGEVVGEMPVAALVDDCPLYDLAPARPPRAGVYPAPAATLAAGAAPRDALLALLAAPNVASRRPLFEQYDPIVQSRTVRRPEEADAAVLALPGRRRARRLDRRQRPPGRRRPLHGDRHGGTGVRGQPRLRRGRAARHDEQPELRQPREAARRLAAHGGRARPGRRVPRAARADRRRQRLALQRGRRRPDLPDAGRGHGRPPARRAPRGAVGLRPRRRRLGARRVEPDAVARGVRAGQAPRRARCPTACRPSTSTHCLAVLDAVRDAVRAGDLASCHDVAEGGFLVALAEACLLGGRGRGRRPAATGPRVDGRAALRRGRLRLPRLGPARGARAPRRAHPARRLGDRGGDALVLDEARRAALVAGGAPRGARARWARSSPESGIRAIRTMLRKGAHRGGVPRTWNAISPVRRHRSARLLAASALSRPGPPRPRRPGERVLALRGRLRVGRLLRLEPGPDGGRRRGRRPERGRPRRAPCRRSCRSPRRRARRRTSARRCPPRSRSSPSAATSGCPRRARAAATSRSSACSTRAAPRVVSIYRQNNTQRHGRPRLRRARTSRRPASWPSSTWATISVHVITAGTSSTVRGARQRGARLHVDDGEPRHGRRPGDPDRQRHGRAGLHAAGRHDRRPRRGRHDAVGAGQRHAADRRRHAAGRADADGQPRAPGPAPSRSPTPTSGSAATAAGASCGADRRAPRRATLRRDRRPTSAHTLRVAVTATNAVGPRRATSNATAVVQGASSRAGEHRRRPRSPARPQVGQVLTAGPGDWNGTAADRPTPTRGSAATAAAPICAPIAGATAPTYTLAAADVGKHDARRRHRHQRGRQRRPARPPRRPPCRRVQTQPGLVALWHMDETSGTTMHDAVGGHTGTLHSVTLGRRRLPRARPTGSTGSSYVSVPDEGRPQPRQREPHGHDPHQDDLGARRRRTGTSSARASTRPRAASGRWSTSPRARPRAASRARRATAR